MVNGYGYHLPDRIIKPAKIVQTPTAGVLFLWVCRDSRKAAQADLVSFLQSQGEQLTRAGNEYRWKRHDSLTVRGNKWYRHSQSKGGAPIDFVMEFYGKSFTEAVELLTGEKGAAQPPDRPSSAPLSDFRLPPPNSDNRTAWYGSRISPLGK